MKKPPLKKGGFAFTLKKLDLFTSKRRVPGVKLGNVFHIKEGSLGHFWLLRGAND